MTAKLFNTLHFKNVKQDNTGTTRSKESNCKLAFSILKVSKNQNDFMKTSFLQKSNAIS